MAVVDFQAIAKFAAVHHADGLTEAQYLEKIQKRPSAWIYWYQNAIAGIQAEKSIQRKEQRRTVLTEKQKEAVEFISEKSVWPTYFDAPTEKYSRSLQSLIKRGLVTRFDSGRRIEYKLNIA